MHAERERNRRPVKSVSRQFILSLAVLGLLAIPAFAQDIEPDPGGGPGDPPRDTPGLAPFVLTGMATAGYFGLQALKRTRFLRKQK